LTLEHIYYKLNKMNQHELDPIVIAIFESDQHLTLREIAEQVFERTGYMPSPSVVKYSLERQEIRSDGGKARRWVWQHNKGRE